MPHQTPALPFPAQPPHDLTPRWCVQRFPAIDASTVWVVGFDGEGYPLCASQVRLTSDLGMWERAAQIEVEAARRTAESGPPPSPRRLRALR